jgi:hypothetical protein
MQTRKKDEKDAIWNRNQNKKTRKTTRNNLESKSKTFRTDKMFLFLIVWSVQIPKDSELFGFEFDADATLLSLFHENGGLDRLNCNGLSNTEKNVNFD